MSHTNNLNWDSASETMALQMQTDACQKLLAELPKEQRDILLAPYLKPAVTTQGSSTTQHASRNLTKATSQRVKDSAGSGSRSRKRRQPVHADEENQTPIDEQTSSSQSRSQSNGEKTYKMLNVFLQNSFSAEIKQNPKKLNDVLKELKPEAKISNIFVCRSGDIKLTPSSPHDENILRQPWSQDKYGPIKPRLPKENTANQEVVITNIPVCITKDEIRESLKTKMIDPKDIFRFNKKGSSDPSVNVKVSLSSKSEKDQLLKEGFFIYSQHFRVVESKPMPTVLQCFKCQKFGHSFFQCKAENSTCLRCSGSHRLSECSSAKENAKCNNCKGDHAASFKGCPIYKQEVAKKQEAEKKAAENKKSFAKIVTPSPQGTNDDQLSIIACLAESLSELVDHFKHCLSNAESPDEMHPFSIVSKAARKHLKIDVSPNDLIVKTFKLSPNLTPEKINSMTRKTQNDPAGQNLSHSMET